MSISTVWLSKWRDGPGFVLGCSIGILAACGEAQSHGAADGAVGGTSNTAGMGEAGAVGGGPVAGTSGSGGRGGAGAGAGGTAATAGADSCGACAPEALCTDGYCAEEVWPVMALARDDEYVYGMRSNGTFRAPLGTADFEQIATGGSLLQGDLLVDGTHLYTAGATGVSAVPKGGGEWTQIAMLQDTFGGRGSATDGTHIYWAVDADADFGIYRVSVSGGDPEYWIRNACADRLAVNAGILMWACHNPNNSVGLSFHALADGPNLDFSYSALAGVLLRNGFAVDSTHVYWDDEDGGVHASPRDGGDPLPLDAAPGEIGWLALDDTRVYFCRDNVLLSIPKSGGTATTLVRFSETCGKYGSILNDAMVVGAGVVYVNADDRLYRVPLP